MDILDPGATGRKTSGPLLPKRAVAARYQVCVKTIDRWVASKTLGFAQPIDINHRQYFYQGQLEAFEIRRAANKETAA